MYFILFRTVASGTVDCAFVGSDTRLNFSWDLVSLRTKTCQEEEHMRRLFACYTSSHFQTAPRTDVQVPGQYDNRCLSKNLSTTRSGAPPGTTCTRSTPLTPAIPTEQYGHSLGFQCLIVTRTEGTGLVKLDLLYAQNLHFVASIRSQFSKFVCPIKKREQPVSVTPCPM